MITIIIILYLIDNQMFTNITRLLSLKIIISLQPNFQYYKCSTT